MNILFLNSARGWGGNEQWTYLAAKCLAGDHNVFMAYRNDSVGNRFDFGIKKHRLPFLFEFDLFSILKIIFIIRKEEVDVLIPTKRKDYVLAGLAAKICGKKNILRLGIVRELHDKWINNLVYNKLADGIIVNAQQIKNILMKSPFINGDKIRVIYNGLDIEALNRSATEKTADKVSSFLICSMGRITNVKGFDNLIRSFKQFLSTTDAGESQLLIIGEGEELDALKKLAMELEIGHKINFSGFMPNPYPYLAASEVFILLSKNEGISNALLEAMFFKNAIVTTAVGGATEIIEHRENGYLIDGIDIVKIGEQLQDLYSSPEKRKKLGEAAHQTVLRRFSLRAMKENIESFLQEIT